MKYIFLFLFFSAEVYAASRSNCGKSIRSDMPILILSQKDKSVLRAARNAQLKEVEWQIKRRELKRQTILKFKDQEYRVLDTLGLGDHGIVYKVQDISTGEVFSLKSKIRDQTPAHPPGVVFENLKKLESLGIPTIADEASAIDTRRGVARLKYVEGVDLYWATLFAKKNGHPVLAKKLAKTLDDYVKRFEKSNAGRMPEESGIHIDRNWVLEINTGRLYLVDPL